MKNEGDELSYYFKHLIDPTKDHLNPMDSIVTLAKGRFSDNILIDKILEEI